MMNYTNLNITSSDKVFKYIVEYSPSSTIEPKNYYQIKSGEDFYLVTEDNSVIHDNVISYSDIRLEQWTGSKTLLGNKQSATINLYFPQFSVDTYIHDVKYLISVNTWVNGHKVYLLSKVVSRVDCVAVENNKRFIGDNYYDMMYFDIVDPFNLTYSDDWKSFREGECGEVAGINNTGSNINISILPVYEVDYKMYGIEQYNGAQNALLLVSDDYIDSSISCTLTTGTVGITPKRYGFTTSVLYNKLFSNIKEYIEETYLIPDLTGYVLNYYFEIRDDNNIYFTQKGNPHWLTDSNLEEYFFPSSLKWDSYIDGMYADVLCSVEKDGNSILVLKSNKIDILPEVFKFLVPNQLTIGDLGDFSSDFSNSFSHGAGGYNINLDNFNMVNYNIDVVNKIVQNVISVERPDDYKSNIQKPIFIKTQPTDSITLHRGVVENISLNLDAYKNKVNVFMLKVGEASFPEIGRIRGGIIFKTNGSLLPSNSTGTYYITNTEQELITTGTYTIE